MGIQYIFFIAGSYGAHVNNVSYLTQKNSIRSKDIRFILNKIGENARKRYDYDLLESAYMEYLTADIDDSESMKKLRDVLNGRKILIIVQGKSMIDNAPQVKEYIKKKT